MQPVWYKKNGSLFLFYFFLIQKKKKLAFLLFHLHAGGESPHVAATTTFATFLHREHLSLETSM
jgi:hypothetical protein